MSEFCAEFIGTMVLILLGNGVVANVVLKGTKGNNGGWIVITLGWGLAVFTGVTIAGPYSGAHLNPAVTIGLAVAGKFAWAKTGMFIVAQMLGAATGALLVWLFYRHHYNETEDRGLILATFATSPAIRKLRNNFFSEVIGTFVLVFVVFYIEGASLCCDTLPDVKIGLGSVGALPVALLVTAIGLSLGGTTGYAINPARDLSPRIIHSLVPIRHKGTSDWAYSWLPVVAPVAGAIIAAVLYLIFK
ncbi:MAG: MIP/aquaporin family protein [Prolixibacteraceae bacterium]|jgi:glycerol uptake facilitator protein|nr:MIP/aquaporin family protein [Prolixibacteraceae bacterium]